ncbi:MAG TPA: DUF5916 domain-containing protein [Vicinamibacterales bacterium]|nr:DUF5916 domain-containing protein [Vicinamibacterales bacterium]
MFRSVSALCAFFCLVGSAWAQVASSASDELASPTGEAVVARDPDGSVTVRATRLARPLELDGQLKEEFYSRIPSIGGFLQQEPLEGEPVTEETQVWLLYDDRNIYVSALLHDSQPEREVISEMRRDGQGTNDNESFGVVLDTFHDRRNGFLFQVSLAGGLFDGYITDERDMNRDWSTVWDARTARTPRGWTVEMAIPFKSLRFPPGSNEWGINLKRVVKWKNENQYLTRMPGALGRRAINKLSSAATLVGIETPQTHRNFELKPYGISGFNTEQPAANRSATSGRGDFGGDVKLGITDGLTADLTYNTDFAQVEEDEQQANLTRFSVLFPEKRDFFLEGQGIFSFGGVSNRPPGGGSNFGNPIQVDVPVMFFSRRIGLVDGREVPIDVGGRITGKSGPYSIGLIDIRTGDVASRGVNPTNFGIVRVKRDILRRSAVGVLYTDRSTTTLGDGHARMAGVDGVFSFFQNLNINSYVAASDNPGRAGRNLSYRGQLDYNADLYGVQLERLALDRNFVPDVGFTRRTAFARNSAYLRYSPRPRSKTIRKMFYEAVYDYVTDPGNRLESRQAMVAVRSELQNGDAIAIEASQNYESLARPFEVSPGVTIPTGGYGFNEVHLLYNPGPQRPLSANVTFEYGQFYNGTRTSISTSRGRLQVSPQITLEPGLTVNAVRMPEGDFTSTLLTTRATYTVNPRMSASALVQYNSTASSFNSNIRFRWEYQPGSDLFVVLTDNRDTTPGGFPELRNRAFVVKLTRLLRF